MIASPCTLYVVDLAAFKFVHEIPLDQLIEQECHPSDLQVLVGDEHIVIVVKKAGKHAVGRFLIFTRRNLRVRAIFSPTS